MCALWSPTGKWLTIWLSFVVSNCEFITFPIGILGQVWYLIVSIPDFCTLTYFFKNKTFSLSDIKLLLQYVSLQESLSYQYYNSSKYNLHTALAQATNHSDT